MRVIYFSQDYTPHDYRFLAKLAQSSYQVWYLRFETSPNLLETRPVPSGVKTIEWMGSKTYQLRGLSKLKLFLDFKRVLRQVQPALIHAGPVQTCGFMVALSGFKPFLLMSWGSDILARTNKNIVKRWITKFTIKRADMITCDCLAVRDKINMLTGYPADRIVVFPWGVNLNQFRPTSSELGLRGKLGWNEDPVVITTRSLEPMYGVEVFLESARRVIQKRPEIRFIIVGSGSLMPEAQSFVAQHNLEHSIYLAGRVPHDTLPHYFGEADLYVSCSYSDGTSPSMLEAMACQLPVVVTDLPPNREWVDPGVNGWLAAAGNPEAFGAAILTALEQRGRLKGVGEANRSVVRQRADWDANFPKLLEAYEHLLGGGHE